jgi:hypothetical protein
MLECTCDHTLPCPEHGGPPGDVYDPSLWRARLMCRALLRTVEEAREAIVARGRGGQQVPFHGDFANAAPSALGRIEWWAKQILASIPDDERAKGEKS